MATPDFVDFGPLKLTRSDNYHWPFTVSLDGAVTNITAWLEFWFTAKKRPGDLDAAAVFSKTKTGAAITLTNAAGGVLQVALVPADTSGLDTRRQRLLCELQGKDAAGAVWTLARGTIDLLPEITVKST